MVLSYHDTASSLYRRWAHDGVASMVQHVNGMCVISRPLVPVCRKTRDLPELLSRIHTHRVQVELVQMNMFLPLAIAGNADSRHYARLRNEGFFVVSGHRCCIQGG